MSDLKQYADRPAELRAGDELPLDAIDAYLKLRIPGLQGQPLLRQFRGGASNLTYQLDYAGRSLILRCPPAGTKAKSAHDMGREFRILKALKPVYPTVPEVYEYCTDEAVMGREFYVMEKLEGIILRAGLPKGMHLSEAQTRQLSEHVLDKLIELHKLDYSKAGLMDIGKGNGYVQRQISGWTERYVKAMTPGAPDGRELMEWLQKNMPTEEKICVIHGDFRFDNVVLSAEDVTRVIGVLDWEMATLGDPLMDLGNSLAYWVEAGDPLPLKQTRRQPTHLVGMPRREEVIAYYLDKMNIKNVDFTFYRIYGLFRLAVIVQQIWYRYYHKQTDNPQFRHFGLLVQYLDFYCRELLAGKGTGRYIMMGEKALLYWRMWRSTQH